MYSVHYVRSFKAAATVRTWLHRILNHRCGGKLELVKVKLKVKFMSDGV